MSIVNKVLDKISEYLRVRFEKAKLDVISQVSLLLANILAFVFLGIIALFLMIFLSFALSAYLNEILASAYLGYLIISGFYLILLIIIILLLKTNKIQKWLESLFVNITENMNNGDE